MLKNQYNKRSNNVNIMSLACCLPASSYIQLNGFFLSKFQRVGKNETETERAGEKKKRHTPNLLAETLIHTNKHTNR